MISALAVTLVFSAFLSPAFAATWTGQWESGGSWNTGTDQKPDPITWKTVDKNFPTDAHPARDWTYEEDAIAIGAIHEWAEKLGRYKKAYGSGDYKIEYVAIDKSDISLRWEDSDFFKDWNSVPPGDPGWDGRLDLSGTTGLWFGPANDRSDPVIQKIGTNNPDSQSTKYILMSMRVQK